MGKPENAKIFNNENDNKGRNLVIKLVIKMGICILMKMLKRKIIWNKEKKGIIIKLTKRY